MPHCTPRFPTWQTSGSTIRGRGGSTAGRRRDGDERLRRLYSPAMPEDVAAELRQGFETIRQELDLPGAFPVVVEAAAAEAAARGPAPLPDGRARVDARDVEFLTLDPPGSLDLDQALALERDGDAIVLRYAIADVGAFVEADGVVDREAWRRGETFYAPDVRIPLYPTTLSEGAASLLPGVERPAFLFTVPIAEDGTARLASLERAVIRSGARRAYAKVAERPIPLLQEAGERLAAAARARGAIELHLPETEVVPVEAAGTGPGYRVEVEDRPPSSDWNAELSLVTNMLVGGLLVAGSVGILRTMSPMGDAELRKLRRIAAALGVPWPDDTPLAVVAEAVQGTTPREIAFLRAARRALGRASYRALPLADGEQATHAAVGAPYAHATAPMRRLADRDVLETAWLLTEGQEVPAPLRARLDRLPEVMDRADGLAGRLDARVVDLVEAAMLAGREGEVFEATVTTATGADADVQIAEPPVRARVRLAAPAKAGDVVRVRVVSARVPGAKIELGPA